MLIWDPTVSSGNVLTMVTIAAAAALFLVKHSYTVGKYSQDFAHVHADLKEIKEAIKEQDRVSREASKADLLADGVMRVLQQRVMTLEAETIRSRENIHRLANQIQVELAERGE